MNYRHHFHAGNFADVVKHALLLRVLARLTGEPAPLEVFDTHAGAGGYDLTETPASRSREAESGIARLMTDAETPAVFAELKTAVKAANHGLAEIRVYPGSPWLIAGRLRAGDRLVACELRSDDHAKLVQTLSTLPLRQGAAAEARFADGFEAAAVLAPGNGRTLLLVDPPYERGDDYARTVRSLASARARRPALTALVWAPLKDLATFDGLMTRLEALGFAEGLSAQVRLRSLDDPLKMNGCALIAMGPDVAALRADAEAICGWAVERLGDKGAQAVVERFG